jgi:hypothetical protein
VALLARASGMGFVMPFDKQGFCGAMAKQLDLKWEAFNLQVRQALLRLYYGSITALLRLY